jgi:hypothetical protein
MNVLDKDASFQSGGKLIKPSFELRAIDGLHAQRLLGDRVRISSARTGRAVSERPAGGGRMPSGSGWPLGPAAGRARRNSTLARCGAGRRNDRLVPLSRDPPRLTLRLELALA